MKIKLPLIFTLTILAGLAYSQKSTSQAADSANAQKKLDNTFYCQNTLWGFENIPKTAMQKANLMKEIGFDGLEGWGYKDFSELRDALDSQGIGMPVNYVVINFEADGKMTDVSKDEIKTMIKASAKEDVIYFTRTLSLDLPQFSCCQLGIILNLSSLFITSPDKNKPELGSSTSKSVIIIFSLSER